LSLEVAKYKQLLTEEVLTAVKYLCW